MVASEERHADSVAEVVEVERPVRADDHGHADAVRVLVERGADVNRLNDRGQAPVAGAVFKGEDDVVRALVEGGADPLAGHPTAVDTARMFGREDLLGVLGQT